MLLINILISIFSYSYQTNLIVGPLILFRGFTTKEEYLRTILWGWGSRRKHQILMEEIQEKSDSNALTNQKFT